MIAPSGPVSTDDILTELRKANPNRNYPISTTDADVLALAGKSAGQSVKIPDDFWGKSAIPPFTVTARDDSNTADTRFGAGTVSCAPAVNIIGGTGAKTCSWVVLSNPRPAAVALGSGPSVLISCSYRQNETGSAAVALRCTVVDQAGEQRTVDVSGYLEWGGSN